MSTDERYIQRCLQLAFNGFGNTYPNPMVGCVIVHNNAIIAEGFTSPVGQNHAEVNAINAVEDKSVLKEATLYVSLEPCSHYGKTPPCADLIVKHQVKRVVIGCVDDNSAVSGKGVERLKNAGIEVKVGVLEQECIDLNKRFFTFHNKKRPYIILKYAQTSNGFIAPVKRDSQNPVWISNNYSQQLVHLWRSQEHAILVGTNTVEADNPQLTTRHVVGNNPIRVVLDANLRLPTNAKVFDGASKTIVICDERHFELARAELDSVSPESHLVYRQIDFSKNVAQQICEVLYQENIQSIIIEGGAQTLQTFIDAQLWDEARVFTGNTTFDNGIKAPSLKNAVLKNTQNIKTDTLKTYKPQ